MGILSWLKDKSRTAEARAETSSASKQASAAISSEYNEITRLKQSTNSEDVCEGFRREQQFREMYKKMFK